MKSFRQLVEDANAGGFLNTAFTGFDNQAFGIGHSLNLPTPTLDMPTDIFVTKIVKIRYTDNPIVICLENGKDWKMDKKQWDYCVQMGKEPKEGIRVQIETLADGTLKAINVI